MAVQNGGYSRTCPWRLGWALRLVGHEVGVVGRDGRYVSGVVAATLALPLVEC